jgi:hypothetical protein
MSLTEPDWWKPQLMREDKVEVLWLSREAAAAGAGHGEGAGERDVESKGCGHH